MNPSTAVIKTKTYNIVRSLLSLSLRKHMAIWLNHQKWIEIDRRSWWCLQLVRDLAEIDINEYHKFLWTNHLSYAATYEVHSRFGRERQKKSREIFFLALNEHLSDRGFQPDQDIRSVLEVGCSLGYNLQYLESGDFGMATTLEGIDIDNYAIQTGSEYLRSIGSKVRLQCADMEELESILERKIYDIVICLGVLMYLQEDSAAKVVNVMLRHSRVMLGVAGLAHPDIDNSQLQHSVPRDSDRSFVHNIDSMVTKAGGTILARRWEGRKLVDGHSIYFIFATKTSGTEARQ